MHSGTCARDGKTTYDRETGANKLNELQAVWPAEECWRLSCHAQSYLDQKKNWPKIVSLSKTQLFIWKEISRHRAKGPPNKQWYISAEVRGNRSWKVTFSAKVDDLSTIWRLSELDNTCKYNAWSCIFFDIVHVI